MKNEHAPTKKSAIKTIYAALTLLKKNGGSLPRKELLDQMAKTLNFEKWETERYDSNGQLKWVTIFLFYTIDSIKAGWLIKQKGVWYITEAGEKALKLSPEELFLAANKAYKQWALTKQDGNENGRMEVAAGERIPNPNELPQIVNIEQVEVEANEQIGKYMEQMPEFDFQHLCAVLMQAMGYYIDYEALPGKDGGIDVIVFQDPIGFAKPRVKIQVKRYKEKLKVDVKDIREFKGLLHKGEDIGVFITSGYFTKAAEDFARSADVHIKLINREEFIDLWKSNNHKLKEEERMLLPLRPIYFLNTNE